MSNQTGGPEDQSSSQNRYYDRYIHQAPTGPQSSVPGGSGPGRRSNKGLLIGAGAALAVIVLAVGGFLVFGGGSGNQSGPTSTTDTTTGTATSPTTTTGATSTTSTSSTSNPFGPATVSGWNVVVGDPKIDSAAYDAPADWSAMKRSSTFGYPAAPDSRATYAHVVTQWKAGFCSSSTVQSRAFVGMIDIGSRDPGEAAPAVAEDLAMNIAVKPDKKTLADYTSPNSKTIDVGPAKEQAVESVSTVTVGDRQTSRCDPQKIEVRIVAMSTGTGSAALMMIRYLDGGDVLPPATFDQIVSSFRSKAS